MIGKDHRIAETGTCMIIPPNVRHSMRATEDGPCAYLYIKDRTWTVVGVGADEPLPERPLTMDKSEEIHRHSGDRSAVEVKSLGASQAIVEGVPDCFSPLTDKLQGGYRYGKHVQWIEGERGAFGFFEVPAEFQTSGSGEHEQFYYLCDGEMNARIGGETRRMRPGDIAHIPPGAVYSLDTKGRPSPLRRGARHGLSRRSAGPGRMSSPGEGGGREPPGMGAERIGFIGLGRMGFPMARHLVRAGHDVTAFDIRPEVTERFCAEFGRKPATQLFDLAGCTIVITMLPTSHDVEAVLAGDEPGAGLAFQLTEGALVIDCSSSDPLATRQLGEKLAARGVRTVDAPVAGGVVFAEDGTLDILIGGDEADVARAEPILLAFGKAVRRCGELGSAHAMKLLNNFVNAQALITYAEAMAVGASSASSRRDGRRPAVRPTGRNHPFEKKFVNQVIPRRFASGMALGLISKDVGLAHALASELNAWTPVLHLTAGLWAEADRGLGAGVDQTEVVRLWERRLGVALGGDGTGS